MSRRVWELDALRGLCILGMILVHLVYDIRELYGHSQHGSHAGGCVAESGRR